MKDLMELKNATRLTVVLVALLAAGCGFDGDRFDKLQCVDGNGDVLLLKHNFGDNYFVDNLSEKEPDQNEEKNAKLREKLGS